MGATSENTRRNTHSSMSVAVLPKGASPAGILERYFGGIGGLILFLYASIIIAAEAYLNSDKEGIDRTLVIASALVPMIIVFPFIVRFIRGIKVSESDSGRFLNNKAKRIAWLLLFFTLPLGTLLVWQHAYAPMAVSADVFAQYEQAINNSYNDWHPALHTLLAYKLPMLITGNLDSIVLFQIIGFSAMLSWGAYTLLEYGNIAWALVFELFLLCNPATGPTFMYPWKDLWFGVACGLVAICCLRTFLTRGSWLNAWKHILVAAMSLALACIFRHNGILFCLPCALLMLWLNKRAGAIAAGSALLMIALTRFALYPMMAVEAPGQRTVEVVGLPMSIIGKVVKESPDALDESTAEFVYSVAPQEVWDQYSIAGYNSIKRNEQTNNDAIESYGIGGVLRCMLDCARADPDSALTSLLSLTHYVWSPNTAEWHPVTAITESDTYPELVQADPDSRLTKSLDIYQVASGTYITKYLASIGLSILVVVALMCLKTRPRMYAADRQRLLFCAATLLYCFGTMLLLSGTDYRFFFAMYAVFPLNVFMLLAPLEEDDS